VSEFHRLGDGLLGIETGKSFQTTEAVAREDQLGVLKVSAITWSHFRAAFFDEGLFRPDRPPNRSVSLERLIAHRLQESEPTIPDSSHIPAQWPRIRSRKHLGRNGPLSSGF